jgi:hypothetical protein
MNMQVCRRTLLSERCNYSMATEFYIHFFVLVPVTIVARRVKFRYAGIHNRDEHPYRWGLKFPFASVDT